MNLEHSNKGQTNFLVIFALCAFFFGVYSLFNAHAQWAMTRCLQNEFCVARIETKIAQQLEVEQANSEEVQPVNFQTQNISQ